MSLVLLRDPLIKLHFSIMGWNQKNSDAENNLS